MPVMVARSRDSAGRVSARLGLALAVAYDLKVFFTAAAVPPEEVTTADVLRFMTTQRSGGRSQPHLAGEDTGGVSARTLRRRLSSISGMFAFLQVRGDVAANR